MKCKKVVIRAGGEVANYGQSEVTIDTEYKGFYRVTTQNETRLVNQKFIVYMYPDDEANKRDFLEAQRKFNESIGSRDFSF